MGKGNGTTRAITPATGRDEFDGTLYSGRDELRFEVYVGDTLTGKKEDRELMDRIQKEMKELGIPMNIVGNVSVQISHGSIGDAGGRYNADDYAIQIGIPKRERYGASLMGEGFAKREQFNRAMDTYWHELGHAIHHLYYPKFSDNAVSGKSGTIAYEKAPNEEFARRFQKGIHSWRDSHTSFASYIRSVKKSVDADIASGKLTPLATGKHEEKIARINKGKAIKVYEGGKEKWVAKKYRVIKNGQYKIIAQNNTPE